MHEAILNLDISVSTVSYFTNYLELERIKSHHLLLHGLLDHGLVLLHHRPLGGHAHVTHVPVPEARVLVIMGDGSLSGGRSAVSSSV